MPNYKLLIEYDGTDFAGWQEQPDAPTIQSEIKSAIQKITQQKINLIGSGRTDSGVHAKGQVANFRIDRKLDTYRFPHAVNSLIPPSISIRSFEEVEQDFHARFDAKKRTYLYIFSRKKSAFYNRYSFLNKEVFDMNINNLRDVSGLFVGKHDFTSFSKKNTEVNNKICAIEKIRWIPRSDRIYFFISADRYLHGMVRTIIGTLLKSIKESDSKNYIHKIFELKDRNVAGESVPSNGLFLYKVEY
ncbi:MAG: tRNA pseudouridine(38-40) synthase TruA [Melioribacteraceae bacterium]|nr:tRNA pseudouridine(38-40) synthase TruA [Melioribacteraceae bacterium]MCF8265310.1 tRNA pseudouridine(38-40) synthase TruA [Melioribacteraceae bacterium]MCF8412764.1 tRNA pseudouridine(38-40) synthase TruA [Melioribacteraceae bacterium]